MSTRHAHTHPGWADHARGVLKEQGFSRGGARDAVIEFLDGQDCAASAQEIHRALSGEGRKVGIASVYRSLEALHGLGLVQRFDAGDGEGRYEALPAGGEHHHHVVCDDCARITPFEDPALERAIHALEKRVPYAIAGHDVVLHGRCPDCQKN
jgi:Fur family transcriptional regulator, ferric uptake regulator